MAVSPCSSAGFSWPDRFRLVYADFGQKPAKNQVKGLYWPKNAKIETLPGEGASKCGGSAVHPLWSGCFFG